MFQGNWQCGVCGGAITELPFEPRGSAGLTCRECYTKQKNGETNAAPEPVAESVPDDRDIPDPDMTASAGPDDRDVPDDGAAPATPGERKMFTGDWKCSVCGNAITQLPFEPRSTANLKCLDCFKKQ